MPLRHAFSYDVSVENEIAIEKMSKQKRTIETHFKYTNINNMHAIKMDVFEFLFGIFCWCLALVIISIEQRIIYR